MINVKLYHFPGSRSTRVLWLMYELRGRIVAEISRIDLYGGDQYRSEYLARFPLHAVPAVEISTPEGSPILMTESGAIITFLADAIPSAALAPKLQGFSVERADYLNMIHMCGASLDMMLWQIRIHTHVLGPEQRDEQTAKRYRDKICREVEPLLFARLARSRYICGDDFTAADCMMAHAIIWARTYGLLAGEPVSSYIARVGARPAFQKAYAEARNFDPVVPTESPARAMFTG
ncbi:MAG: glutathione S-transferase family protein [Oxalobacteraceae bacterium]|nr:MAG: glutathione S-transferase family protein [Oxalobacteraceae bacterium]